VPTVQGKLAASRLLTIETLLRPRRATLLLLLMASHGSSLSLSTVTARRDASIAAGAAPLCLITCAYLLAAVAAQQPWWQHMHRCMDATLHQSLCITAAAAASWLAASPRTDSVCRPTA